MSAPSTAGWACVVALYLVIGWASAWVFIHVLTDGYWEREHYFIPGRIVRTKMGIGTGFAWLLLWPFMWVVLAILFVACVLFDADTWRKVFGVE